ncbi:MAG: helix-turn-helix domain-containing protein [Pseudonocardiaceae bacterium]
MYDVDPAQFHSPGSEIESTAIVPSSVPSSSAIRVLPALIDSVSRAERRLSLAERDEISRGLAADLVFQAIASGLGCSPSTVSREITNNDGCAGYQAAWSRSRAAWSRAQRRRVLTPSTLNI